MDDANITLNYAENISGFGYVYYVDGEKVEDRSLIWTFINVIFFKISNHQVLINIYFSININCLLYFFSSNLSIN